MTEPRHRQPGPAAPGHPHGTAPRSRAGLDVAYAEKDEAKRLGAQCDPAVRRWQLRRAHFTVVKPLASGRSSAR
jgi:hypothetical protein